MTIGHHSIIQEDLSLDHRRLRIYYWENYETLLIPHCHCKQITRIISVFVVSPLNVNVGGLHVTSRRVWWSNTKKYLSILLWAPLVVCEPHLMTHWRLVAINGWYWKNADLFYLELLKISLGNITDSQTK